MNRIFVLLLLSASMACTDAFAGGSATVAGAARKSEAEVSGKKYARRYDWYYKKDDTDRNRKTAWGRKTALRVGYVSQTLKPEYGGSLKSDMGFFFANRQNIYIAPRRAPIGGILRFAVDIGVDINYVKYKGKGFGSFDFGNSGSEIPGAGGSSPDDFESGDFDYDDDWSDIGDIGLHHLDIGFAVGPSVIVNPVDHLRVNAYFHFVPSYSGMLLEESFSHGFLPAFSCGGEVSYKVIGLGVEARFGKAKYKNLEVDEDSEDGVGNSMSKYSISGLRAYVSFRF